MSEWKEYTLGELVNLSQGQVINSKTNHLVVKEGIPLLRITDMINGTKTIFIDSEKVAKKNIAFQDELIFTRTGQVGLVFMNQHGVVHNNSFKVIPKDDTVVYRKFLFWYLKSNTVYEYINGVASGSAQPDLTHDSFKSLTIKLPPLATQQKIANILGTYDELIEVNNERIKILEETAQSLYKEWFVRFRFPNYQDTEFIKGVPKGWEVKEIKGFGKVVTGKTPSTSNPSYFNGEVPFIKTPDMHGNMFVLKTSETLTELGVQSQRNQTIPKYSIIVNCIGSLSGTVSITTERSQTNQQINSLILNNINNLEYLYFAIADLKEMIELYGNTGSTMTNLSKGKFEGLKILKPLDYLLEDFHNLVNPMFIQIETLQQQNTELRQIRDRLLPRLISGKLLV